MATIDDVARLAGVSASTVSYAMSGKRPISAATRARIDRAVQELGFTPHAGARALATARTMVIGLFVQFLASEFPPAMLQYVLPIADAAREAGYDILMLTEEDGPAALRRVGSTGMVDGFILLNVVDRDPRLAELRRLHQPAALVGLPADTEGLSVVDLDFAAAARLVVDRLHADGHRSTVLITPSTEVIAMGGAYAWRFRDAFLGRAAEHGIRVRTHAGATIQPELGEQLGGILDDLGDATSLVVHNDAQIAALPSLLSARGIEVPRDLSVISLFSEEFGRLFSLPFTSIETGPDRLGRHAVASLLAQIDGADDAGGVSFVAPALVERGSVAPPSR
ncbi:LacI family DNA-binding transcriptional regulator [Pseudolysinimonas sp.]|uniref:LacI family DNA-binding transcriptional regulator n=1 Tax=Pseudolysinimonas sp. TaxID=2680009 RepID=UPI003F7F7F0D